MIANIAIINAYYGIECYADISSDTITNANIIDTTYGIVFEYVTNSIVSNSTIMNAQDVGISLKDSSRNNMITGNTITNNKCGVRIESFTPNNCFYHNNFINNIKHVYANSDGTWNSSYPDGGNYWSDFDEPSEHAYDDFSGVDQLSPGSDGIIDQGLPGGGINPHHLQNCGVDYYPFMSPYGWINNPPDTPQKPVGPRRGTTRGQYTYTTMTTDPEGYPIYYNFSWDDGMYSGWLGPYPSGEKVSASHRWTTPDVYDVRVKARDTRGSESDWSESLRVRIFDAQISGQVERPN
jgi:parallel beta-helix repeat protein